MADLTDGRYPQVNSEWAITGQQTNVAQSDIPSRSNVEWLGLSGAIATTTLVATGVGAAVAVPVDQETVISKVTMYVTATAAGTPTHAFAALYAGTPVAAPPLIAGSASTDSTTAAIAANAAFSFTIPPTLITPANAPAGFIYVSISITATTVPTVVTVPGPTIGAWGTMVPPTTAPLFFSATHGSALAGTAAATIVSPSNVSQAPLLVLT
jgi:hypothetical protein